MKAYMYDILRSAKRFYEENDLQKVAECVAEEAFKKYIQPKLQDIWDWITDNWDDIWDTVWTVLTGLMGAS
jgi:hypothetical protein